MQSSVAEGGIPQKAVDGSSATAFSADTCTLTNTERNPWWYVNLLEPYMVQLVRLDFGQSCCGTLVLTVSVADGCAYIFPHTHVDSVYPLLICKLKYRSDDYNHISKIDHFHTL